MPKLGHLSLVKVLEEKNGKNEHVLQWPQSRSRSQFRLEKTKLPLRNSRANQIAELICVNSAHRTQLWQFSQILISSRGIRSGFQTSEPFEFSLRSASSKHYIERNEISSTTLPIVIIHCEIEKTIDYCSCPVYSLQCQ